MVACSDGNIFWWARANSHISDGLDYHARWQERVHQSPYVRPWYMQFHWTAMDLLAIPHPELSRYSMTRIFRYRLRRLETIEKARTFHFDPLKSASCLGMGYGMLYLASRLGYSASEGLFKILGIGSRPLMLKSLAGNVALQVVHLGNLQWFVRSREHEHYFGRRSPSLLPSSCCTKSCRRRERTTVLWKNALGLPDACLGVLLSASSMRWKQPWGLLCQRDSRSGKASHQDEIFDHRVHRSWTRCIDWSSTWSGLHTARSNIRPTSRSYFHPDRRSGPWHQKLHSLTVCHKPSWRVLPCDISWPISEPNAP